MSRKVGILRGGGGGPLPPGGGGGALEQRSAEAKSLKTKRKGTVRLLFKQAAAEAARRRASGPDKRATLVTYLLKKGRIEKQLFA